MPIRPREQSLNVPQQTGIVRAPRLAGVGIGAGSSLWEGLPDPNAALTPEPGFVGSGYTITAELWRATIDNALVEDVSDLLVDGAIDLNLDRDVKLAASLTVREPARFSPYQDFLAPFVRIAYDDGSPDVYRQVGLFATRVPPGTYGPTDAVATFAADELTSVMATSYYTDAQNVAAGTNYVSGGSGITGAITGSGISRYNLPATASTLAVAQTFPIGTSRLAKANTLLDQLGWYHLGMGLDGQISTPGAPQALTDLEPWRTLTDEDVFSLIDVAPSGIEIANVVLVVNNDPAAAPLSSIATNDDPDSPTSTVSLGRSVMRLVTVSGTTTQAALDALASRYLAESRTFYRQIRFTIAHDPTALVAHQCVRLTLSGEWSDLSGLWWVRTASLGLTPDKPTVITANQVTDDLIGVAI